MHYFPRNTGPQKTAARFEFPAKTTWPAAVALVCFLARTASLEWYLYRSAGKVENRPGKGAAGVGNRRHSSVARLGELSQIGRFFRSIFSNNRSIPSIVTRKHPINQSINQYFEWLVADFKIRAKIKVFRRYFANLATLRQAPTHLASAVANMWYRLKTETAGSGYV